eukprot:GHRR01031491.1.p1 GENE.GHRR01031491.1~~GHRR01031491.1.p1  ORF type:complete len:123 (-),score=20.04 GHRR01031491.1:46-414(-)
MLQVSATAASLLTLYHISIVGLQLLYKAAARYYCPGLSMHRYFVLYRIILTASGGAFRDWPVEKLSEVTVEQAITHPNWSMGKKITIDSATLMNKGLEVNHRASQACCLFCLLWLKLAALGP